jgi:hypothetical protein
MDAIADIDDPFGDLAGDAEAEIGLVTRARTTPTNSRLAFSDWNVTRCTCTGRSGLAMAETA